MSNILLSKVELMYLANTKFLSADLVNIVDYAQSVGEEGRLLNLDHVTAERFRDEFTLRLAKIGFGSDYEPTREGKLLEDLIDRFDVNE